jgi:hypothetical protein
MQFEVDPGPVRGGSHRQALIAALGALGVIVLALASAIGLGTPDVPRSAAHSAPVVPPGQADLADGLPAVPASSASPAPGRLPGADAIDCHDLAPGPCAAVSLASVRELDGDRLGVTAIDAWQSLLCGDDFDCPRPRLTGNRPLGSAIVTVDTGARAWVNVLETGSSPGDGAAPDRTIAWIIRWVP